MDKRIALYVMCSQFHSGQWSRGYRLLCRLSETLGLTLSHHNRNGFFDNPQQLLAYYRWVRDYKEAV